MKNLKKEFAREFEILARAEKLFKKMDDPAEGFNTLKESYIDLIRQQSKLMRIGDKTQLRLREAQTKINRELRIASEYVRSLLPEELDTPELSINYHFEPSEELGGDALGFHFIDNENFAIYLLDVSGHGVGPALHSVSVINNLRFDTIRDTNFLEPASVLTALNEKYLMGEYNNMFFTIFYAVYNIKSKVLKFSEAGHPHANLHCGKELRSLECGGPAIGFIPDTNYEQDEIKISANSFLYIYSDAAFEFADSDGNLATKKDFEKILSDKGIVSSPKDIYSHILRFSNSRKMEDDFSFIKIHLK